jgi:hypothetical protein
MHSVHGVQQLKALRSILEQQQPLQHALITLIGRLPLGSDRPQRADVTKLLQAAADRTAVRADAQLQASSPQQQSANVTKLLQAAAMTGSGISRLQG